MTTHTKVNRKNKANKLPTAKQKQAAKKNLTAQLKAAQANKMAGRKSQYSQNSRVYNPWINPSTGVMEGPLMAGSKRKRKGI